MKLRTQIMPLALAGLLALCTSSCNDDDASTPITEPQVTIAEFTAANPSYTSLVAALTATDLLGVVSDPTANLTVFAPDNAAFSAFLSEAGFTLDTATPAQLEVVKSVLLNHVIGVELKASDVIGSAPGYVKNSAVGPKDVAGLDTNLSTFYSVAEDKVMINGAVEVTTPDFYDALNGVIHAVDKVIGLPMLSTFVLADDRVSSLRDALVAAELVETVDGLGTATVLAPINAAFDALGDDAPTGDALAAVLTYHVIAEANATASDVTSLIGMQTPPTVQTGTIGVVTGPALLGIGNDNNDDADNTDFTNLVLTDIQATNGVIHVIDGILLPTVAVVPDSVEEMN